jgi:hypothetical protein
MTLYRALGFRSLSPRLTGLSTLLLAAALAVVVVLLLVAVVAVVATPLRALRFSLPAHLGLLP